MSEEISIGSVWQRSGGVPITVVAVAAGKVFYSWVYHEKEYAECTSKISFLQAFKPYKEPRRYKKYHLLYSLQNGDIILGVLGYDSEKEARQRNNMTRIIGVTLVEWEEKWTE